MNVRELVVTALTQPRVLLPYRRILLLSHMRANTSLFGHLLAENPEIDGYFELHIGYHSWRSLQRQKFMFASTEKLKPRARYMFDKVLHNDHGVKMELFEHDKIVFMLRPPEKTIPSIVSLYAREDSNHPFSTPAGAAAYYRQRVEKLAELLDRALGPVCYVDADALRVDPENTLIALSEFLELKTPLAQDYSPRAMTGKPRGGDSSQHINAGKIVEKTSNYQNVAQLPPHEMQQLRRSYESVRCRFLSNPKVIKIADREETCS